MLLMRCIINNCYVKCSGTLQLSLYFTNHASRMPQSLCIPSTCDAHSDVNSENTFAVNSYRMLSSYHMLEVGLLDICQVVAAF